MSTLFHESTKDGGFILITDVPGPEDITINIVAGWRGKLNMSRAEWEKMRDAIDGAFKRATKIEWDNNSGPHLVGVHGKHRVSILRTGEGWFDIFYDHKVIRKDVTDQATAVKLLEMYIVNLQKS